MLVTQVTERTEIHIFSAQNFPGAGPESSRRDFLRARLQRHRSGEDLRQCQRPLL